MINPIRKISDQEKSDNYIRIRKFLQSLLKSTLSTRLANDCAELYIFFYSLQMTWISELTGHREWSFLKTLTDFTQLGTKLDPILNYSKIYIKWKKRLIQGYVKSEQVFAQIGDFCLLTVNILGHLWMNIIRICKLLFYTIDEFLLRIWLERNSLTVMSFKSCVFTSERHYLYC